jgi:hypothetical protein
MDPSGKKGRKRTTRQQRETAPGPSRIPDIQQIPPKELGPEIPSVSPTPSEIKLERGLDFLEKQADRVCQEGGVKFLHFLINKAISPNAKLTTTPKEWSLKDIACLPELEQKEWKDACLQELEALKRCDVFELTPRPQGQKVIKNRWVFDVKTDGRKKARLVAKGFSQVEGLDYD